MLSVHLTGVNEARERKHGSVRLTKRKTIQNRWCKRERENFRESFFPPTWGVRRERRAWNPGESLRMLSIAENVHRKEEKRVAIQTSGRYIYIHVRSFPKAQATPEGLAKWANGVWVVLVVVKRRESHSSQSCPNCQIEVSRRDSRLPRVKRFFRTAML